jgi:zinc D-Ala-D-Ala carboxypeptidase
MNLSTHFTLEEMTRSATARRFNISNIPDSRQIESLRLLCVNVLEPVRATIGLPIHIDDAYRCPALNKKVGGVEDSQHQCLPNEGAAADFTIIGRTTAREVFDGIVSSPTLEYDEVILEFEEWIHISFRLGNNRRKKSIASKDSNDKTVYLNIL